MRCPKINLDKFIGYIEKSFSFVSTEDLNDCFIFGFHAEKRINLYTMDSTCSFIRGCCYRTGEFYPE